MEQIKEIIALLVLVTCTYTDIKERQVYILPLLVGGMASMAISIIICITNPVGETIKSIFSWIVFPVLFGAFVLFFIELSKGNIGKGDGYLALVLGLCLGVSREIRTLCLSVVLAGLFCLGLIFFNKDKLWKNIPFVPFVLMGFVMTMIVKI